MIASMDSTSDKTCQIDRLLSFRSFLTYAMFTIRLHNPFTQNGRKQIKKTILASGPAEYESSTASAKRSHAPTRFSGWRFGSLIACIEVGLCLGINILFSVLATAIKGAPNGIGTLYQGDCGKVHNIDTWVHVALNGLATILIGASNYNMQCLGAPSRSEVDKAHLNGTSLDIGVPSIRNLSYISRRRIVLWTILCISTVPSHVLWNSAIFSTLQDNWYLQIGISTDVLYDTSFKCPMSSIGLIGESYDSRDYNDIICGFYDSIRHPSTASVQLHRLEADECIQQYDKDMQAGWSNFAVIYNSSGSWTCNSCYSELAPSNLTDSFSWLSNDFSPFSEGSHPSLDSSCALRSFTAPAGYWSTDFEQACSSPNMSAKPWSAIATISYSIDYCLASKAPQICKLQFSLWVMIVVILCNFAKLLAMICTLRLVKEDHFITLGDAVSSFLKDVDSDTVGYSFNAEAKLYGSATSTTSHPTWKKSTWLHAIARVRLWSIFIL